MTDWDDLADILDDDELFADMDWDDKLFDTSRYAGTVSQLAKRTARQRHRMGTGFDQYKELFDRVHREIEQGLRQVKSFEEIANLSRISKKNPIKQGNFYVDNGVMLYVASIYNPDTGENFEESTDRKNKVHTIYENGTENHIWLLSLISSLYDKKRHGRFVTELANWELMGHPAASVEEEPVAYSDKDILTGHIYVVQYAGEDRQFRDLPNLYKIGVAKNLDQRLRGTEKQATYLYAPVHLVRDYDIINIDAQKVEKAIHHRLADKRPLLTVTDPSGRTVEAMEWFIVDLEEMDRLVDELFEELQG